MDKVYIRRTIEQYPGLIYVSEVATTDEVLSLKAKLANSHGHPKLDGLESVIILRETTRNVRNGSGNSKRAVSCATLMYVELVTGEFLQILDNLDFGLPTSSKAVGKAIIDFLNEGVVKGK